MIFCFQESESEDELAGYEQDNSDDDEAQVQ